MRTLIVYMAICLIALPASIAGFIAHFVVTGFALGREAADAWEVRAIGRRVD